MFDEDTLTYITRNGKFKLSRKESITLLKLINNRGKVVQIDYKDIFQLRKKLKKECDIKRKRGVGYYI